jgi:hypothetical protein
MSPLLAIPDSILIISSKYFSCILLFAFVSLTIYLYS